MFGDSERNLSFFTSHLYCSTPFLGFLTFPSSFLQSNSHPACFSSESRDFLGTNKEERAASMFTPQQRKQWSASASGKGKNVVVDTAVRSTAWLGQDWLAARAGEAEEGDDEAVVWRRFREAGMLDEAELQRKDRQGLLQRISELEREVCFQKNDTLSILRLAVVVMPFCVY